MFDCFEKFLNNFKSIIGIRSSVILREKKYSKSLRIISLETITMILMRENIKQ